VHWDRRHPAPNRGHAPLDSLRPLPRLYPEETEALALRYGADALKLGGRPPVRGIETIASLLRSTAPYAASCPPGAWPSPGTLVAAAQSAATSSNMQFLVAITAPIPPIARSWPRSAGDQKHIEQLPALHLLGSPTLSRTSGWGRAKRTDSRAGLARDLHGGPDRCIPAAHNAAVGRRPVAARPPPSIWRHRNDPVRVAQRLVLPPKCFVGSSLWSSTVPSQAKNR